ncbi:MAG TPA: response regulator [bacterium]|nr:response regulator [bacterium]
MDEKKTILVVDDDIDFAAQVETALKGAGYAVIVAEGEKQAEALLAGMRPDLAVVDLMMEQMDGGFALAYHIKKRYPDVPVLIASAVTAETGLEFDAATEEERSWVKADAFLAKPIRPEQLVREIKRLLRES